MIELCCLNISSRGSTTGVDRYLSVLIDGLAKYDCNILLIEFVYNDSIIFSKYTQHDNYKKLVVPLPQKYSNFLNESYWMEKYFDVAVRKIISFLKKDMIFHVNSFNLMPLAIKLRQDLGGKIVSHVHFIPWKEHYEHNKRLFNKLYAQYYFGIIEPKSFFVNHLEKMFLIAADRIVCVTNSGRNFVHELTNIPIENIELITNGFDDYSVDTRKNKTNNDKVEILFAGRVCEGKGIFFVLEALELVKKRGYNFTFLIAGACEEATKSMIYNKYRNLTIKVLDNLDFVQLKELYSSADIGVIPSLKEQASYVAIEMAMFGLPVVCTAVDGLDEIFSDETNALKVPLRFSKITGLTINVNEMADKIISLIKNEKLRIFLSENIRLLYEEKFTLNQMINKTIALYEALNRK